MIVYLAGFKTIEKHYKEPTKDIWLLSSFFEHKNGKFGDYVYNEKHILDSGAFSTFKDIEKAKLFNWDDYVKKYIAFINHTKQKLFFELDIDAVVGLKKVEYFRKQIEDGTGIQPIPCWHSNRGWDYWLKCCEEYPYVALGTTKANADGKKIRANPMILKNFIDTAHKQNAKIHGLGFTSIPYLHELKFDSVDSTTWNVGKFGNVCFFQNNQYSKQWKPANIKVKDMTGLHLYNFNEWVKFQKYAEHNL